MSPEQRSPTVCKASDEKRRQEVKMIKTPVTMQELRKKIYVKAKAEPQWRFWGMYTHVCKKEVLMTAYKMVKAKNGSPGIDGITFEDIEEQGLEEYIERIREELKSEKYYPAKYRNVEIPKNNGKTRILKIPTIKDRIVQGAIKLIIEPIFEADFQDGSYGFRPKRSAQAAVDRVRHALVLGKIEVIDIDLSKYFDNIRHHILFEKVAERINDPKIMHLVKIICKTAGKKGVPQGGVISPLLANIYLNEVDKMLEKAKKTTGNKVEYSRYADDLVVLIEPGYGWTNKVYKRLKEELTKIEVEINEEKSQVIEMTGGGKSFIFLGFESRMIRGKNGKMRPDFRPNKKSKKKLLDKLRDLFKRYKSQPVRAIVEKANPIIRGWLNYFRIGNASRIFGYIELWVDKKLRRHLMKARKRKGFGWKRWSTNEIQEMTGIYSDYRIKYYRPKVNQLKEVT